VRRVILHNFWLKIISIGLGALIWLALHSKAQSDATPAQQRITGLKAKQRFKVPIYVIVQPGDSRVFKLSQREATLDVVGEDSVLRKLMTRDLRVYVDLTDLNTVQPAIRSLRPHIPPDLTVGDVQPPSVTVETVPPLPNLK
jgi:hypothetical protein